MFPKYYNLWSTLFAYKSPHEYTQLLGYFRQTAFFEQRFQWMLPIDAIMHTKWFTLIKSCFNIFSPSVSSKELCFKQKNSTCSFKPLSRWELLCAMIQPVLYLKGPYCVDLFRIFFSIPLSVTFMSISATCDSWGDITVIDFLLCKLNITSN